MNNNIVAINIYLRSLDYIKTNYRALLGTAFLFIGLPLFHKHQILQHLRLNLRHSNLTTNNNLHLLLKDRKNLYLRVRIIGLSDSHSFEAVHHPFFTHSSSSSSDLQNSSTKGNFLTFKLSGVHYPLEERTLRELKFKHSLDIYNKVWWVNLNFRENQIQNS